MRIDDHISNEIEHTMSTEGWAYIEQMLRDAIDEPKKPKYLDTKGKTNERIVAEVIAAEQASKALNSVLGQLKRASRKYKSKSEKYV